MNVLGLNVAVVGGGIGGMAVATALAQRGAAVQLFEQAPALTEVGAGLQVSANGQSVLRALGVEVGSAYVSSGTQIRDGRSGRKVALVPLPEAGSSWYVHRADLLAALVRAAETAGVEITLDRVVTPGTVAADLLIAADGHQSVWRSHVDGPVTPAFSGQVAWRALVPQETPVPPGQHASLSMGSRAHVVSYPIRSGRLMNIVAVEERSAWTQEGWRQAGDPEEFRARFADFAGDAGDLVRQAGDIHVWALHTRNVARRWVDGTLALLGDAAHPTLPFMAQGACLALEDAWVLADAVEAARDVPEGLHRYQQLRRGRAERIVGMARANAWRFHLPRPWAWGAQAVLAAGAGALARRLEFVYGYDATRAISG